MASRTEIIEALESLAVHCRPPLMSVEDRSRWMTDWCDDLADSDGEAIRTACQRWRMGTDRKFPLPGQLIPLIKAVTTKARTGQKIVHDEPWRPLTDAEYRELTVREKVRHHRIMAGEIRRKAGPMWTGGRHALLEEMSDTWHKLQAEAKHHDKEAKRLNDIMRAPQSIA